MADQSHVRITGPLSNHGRGFWDDLLSQGYTPLSSRNLLRLTAHLSRWMEEKCVRPDQLETERIEEFVRDRRQAGYTSFPSRRGLGPLLRYLRDAGVVPMVKAPTVEETPLGRLLSRYEDYLEKERGLVSGTTQSYRVLAQRFLSERFGPDPDPDIDSLSAADVMSFILRESRSTRVGYLKLKITALRSLLRYLHLQGDLDHDMSHAVPAASGGRLLGLPKALSPELVKKLFGGCDRRTHVGRRDFAAMLLMLRVGLRACEVAALKLDDIHWARGELVIHGKGGQEDRLPLPHDVGEAIAAYLRHARPRKNSRALFLHVRAPHRDIRASGMTRLVQNAADRAGLGPIGAHRLRHTAATRMLSHGASLPEIAQVLRHRSLNTTAIYAKVDRSALRTVARPWPRASS